MTPRTPLAAVHERMAAAVSSPDLRTERLYAWLRYQLGWADTEGAPADTRAGKGVRPLACLTACRAVGGREQDAVPAAAAIELTHEFSLVHDDIEDGDRLRRGRPALWTICGLAHGVNAGDALFGIARRELGRSAVAPDTLARMSARYDEACVRLAEGQYLDLSMEDRDDVSPEEYVDMVSRKTGALLAAATAMGAVAGGAGEDTAAAFHRFGEQVGVAFQIWDDILGIWGDPAVTGKPAGADLARRKKGLPVLLALDEPRAAGIVLRLYATEPSAVDVEETAAGMLQLGVRVAAEELARERARDALRALDEVELVAGPRAELESLARRAIDRAR